MILIFKSFVNVEDTVPSNLKFLFESNSIELMAMAIYVMLWSI